LPPSCGGWVPQPPLPGWQDRREDNDDEAWSAGLRHRGVPLDQLIGDRIEVLPDVVRLRADVERGVALAQDEREGNAPLDVGPQPDYIGKDLDAIADQLIERYAAVSKAS